jgi:hypothetical protein
MPVLAPSPKFRAVGADGLALVGGKLYTYTAGTSTPKESFTDYGLGTANTNPVILDARGECDLWLSGSYKLTLTDADDALIWSVDDIRDLTNSATLQNVTLTGTLTVTGSQVAWPGDPIHTGNHRFANNVTVNGHTVLGDAAGDTLTVSADTVTWGAATVTHSSNHVFSGNVTAGSSAADVVTVNGTASFPLAVTTHTFGAILGNVARAGATILDWYEEGVFTPTVAFGGASVGVTYTTQQGAFTRIGNVITYTLNVQLSAKGSSTGNVTIGGFPYASGATYSYVSGVVDYGSTSSIGGNVIGRIGAASSSMALSYTSVVATGGGTFINDTHFNNTTYIATSGSYRA